MPTRTLLGWMRWLLTTDSNELELVSVFRSHVFADELKRPICLQLQTTASGSQLHFEMLDEPWASCRSRGAFFHLHLVQEDALALFGTQGPPVFEEPCPISFQR